MTDQRPRAEDWRYRATYLGLGIAALLVVVAVLLGVNSLTNLYHGDPSPSGDVTTTRASTAIGRCDRAGPVSVSGYGYWWTCDVTLTLADGRTVTTTVDRSTVTPADRADPPTLVEHCQHTGFTDCAYSRTGGNGWLAFLLVLSARVVWFVCAIFALLAGVPVLRGILGPRLLLRLFGRPARPAPPPRTDLPPGGEPAPVNPEPAPPAGREISTARLLLGVALLYGLVYLGYLLLS